MAFPNGLLGREEVEAIRRELAQEGFIIHEMPRDGDCLFRAIYHGLGIHNISRPHSLQLMRARVGMAIRENIGNAYISNYFSFRGMGTEEIDQEIEGYINGSLWGNDCCIMAAALSFNVNIVVISGPSRFRFPDVPVTRRPTVFLSYYNYHYNLLVPGRELQEIMDRDGNDAAMEE